MGWHVDEGCCDGLGPSNYGTPLTKEEQQDIDAAIKAAGVLDPMEALQRRVKLEEPDDKDIENLVSWFMKRDGIPLLQGWLNERGYDSLTDKREVLAALEMAFESLSYQLF